MKEIYNRLFSLFLSFIIPGLGIYFSGRRLRGIIWYIVITFLSLLFQITLISKLFPGITVLLIILALQLMLSIIMLIDSYEPIINISLRKIFQIVIIIIIISILENRFLYFVDFGKGSTGSMEPTIISISCSNKFFQDRVIVDNISYKFRAPRCGEIITFLTTNITNNHYPTLSLKLTKRIVGLPGEKVSINPPYVYINGRKLINPPIFRKISEKKNAYKGYFLPVINVNNAILKNTNDVIT